ncbi:MAG: hypothetical protein KKD25_06745 [Gammaproteobacteria bacterium]|jgi:hypothetical protein|nr:hypothetical protein [Gammaproteobacteria bacterium]MBU0772292.1 hypothetical protein [Gammaproteobacteria bacterium]MBU0857903.1 hypothetical protein [Gammaproteobacteria bacterium]MBU1848419.1 hypothetical protein [Gammaproteobacteria bacterium]
MHRFILFLSIALAVLGARAEDEDPTKFVTFSEDFAGRCVSRNSVQILISNSHPTRSVKVWLDRYHMGVGTGDRSRTEMKPAAEPVPLGCSRTLDGPQEWRIVKAQFLD